MGYIYKIINDINQKVYIGQTKRTIERRWSEHQKYANEEDSKSKLYLAMKEIGINHFKIEPIEQIYGVEERNIREKYWIKYYNSFYDGYNSTRGGGCFEITTMGKKELFDKIIELRLEGKSYEELTTIFQCGKNTISEALAYGNLLGNDCRSLEKTPMILEMLSQGEYLVNIAKELKCDFYVIKKILKEHPEFEVIYQNTYNPFDQKIYYLKDTTKMTNAMIAKQLNCSERTIYRALNRRKKYNT